MKAVFGILIAAAYVCGTSALPPCVCTRNLRPVCGSDGETYSNECLLECENHRTQKGITVAKQGSCDGQDELCICTDDYTPVCGADGVTYSNLCTAACAHVEVSKTGACAEQPPCVCTKEKKPVCGTDGVTYSNACLLNCQTAKNSALGIANRGPCQNTHADPSPAKPSRGCTCGRNLLPVCSTDGVTYSNECLLECAGKQKMKDAACEEVAVIDF